MGMKEASHRKTSCWTVHLSDRALPMSTVISPLFSLNPLSYLLCGCALSSEPVWVSPTDLQISRDAEQGTGSECVPPRWDHKPGGSSVLGSATGGDQGLGASF